MRIPCTIRCDRRPAQAPIAENPGVPGGPASSPIGRPILEAFPCVDFVVRGEGEITFADLLKTLHRDQKPSAVHGLTWRDADNVVDNPERELVDNLDDLPVPFYDGYEMESGAALYLDVGRGCPFDCRFCGTAPFWKRKYRMKSIDRILAEMTLLRDRYGRRHVNFSHDIFTCNRDWTQQFCERLSEAKLGMTWTCSTRTDLINETLLGAMAAAGCTEIYYGIESGSNAAQIAIQKNLDLDDVRGIVRSTVAAGIHPITGFIVGYPTETFESFSDTLAAFFEFMQIGRFRAHLFTLCPYHDSALYRDHWRSAVEMSECYDLPLVPAAQVPGDELRHQHPIILASTRRYSCEKIPAKLVTASEELSTKLVVLKSVWPLLLPHYASPLEWYQRWVDWIEAYNAEHRPHTRWPHQCDPDDLLTFIAEELRRLDLADSDLADLVRYEQLKLDASSLAARVSAREPSEERIDAEAIVVRRCDYVGAPFRHDIRALLAGREATGPENERWIVCVRNVQGDLKTIELPTAGRMILEAASEPHSVAALSAAVLADSPNASAVLDDGVGLVRQLVGHGLLEQVVTQ